MIKIYKLLKIIIPQKILNLIYNLKYQKVKYIGPYNNWFEAKKNSRGWSDQKILEKVKKSTLASMNNSNTYERDGEILRDNMYPVNIVKFLNSELNENNLVIDFGGSLGSLYFHIRSKIGIENIKWSIIEQTNYVNLGKKIVQNKEISFFEDLKDVEKVDGTIIILSSILQYVENPEKIINQIINLKSIKHIILDRLILSNSNQDKIYVQKNPRKYLNTSYPIRIFSEEKFLEYFKNFKTIFKGESYIGTNFELDGNKLNYCNIIFSRIEGPK